MVVVRCPSCKALAWHVWTQECGACGDRPDWMKARGAVPMQPGAPPSEEIVRDLRDLRERSAYDVGWLWDSAYRQALGIEKEERPNGLDGTGGSHDNRLGRF